MTEENPYVAACFEREASKPHAAHAVDIARCEHDRNTYCYGVPEPGSLQDQIARLQPGQRIRVVWEGSVEPVKDYPMSKHCRSAVVLAADSDEGADRLVLRYTGADPWRGERADLVAGKVNGGTVSIEVLD